MPWITKDYLHIKQISALRPLSPPKSEPSGRTPLA